MTTVTWHKTIELIILLSVWGNQWLTLAGFDMLSRQNYQSVPQWPHNAVKIYTCSTALYSLYAATDGPD